MNLFSSLIFICTLINLITFTTCKDKFGGQCDATGALDLYLLVPTSAHVNRTRLTEVRSLLSASFREADLTGNDKNDVRVTAITYKKLPNVAFSFTPGSNDYDNLLLDIKSKLVVRARAAPKEVPPTFATEGLNFFIQQYQRDKATLQRRQNVPAVLIFFVLESLNPIDLNNMATSLVAISSDLDIFSFIFIANPDGKKSSEEAKFNLPHKAWNAIAVDDNSDIMKYENVVRKTMCRTANTQLCLLMKDIAKSETATKNTIQTAAEKRTAVNNRAAKPDKIVVSPDSCCSDKIYDPNYDSNVQKCCVGVSGKFSVVEIDEECK